MDQDSHTCTICGCSESNLVNGFYYCMECGTQDMTIRETVVENVLADGTVQLFQKKVINKKQPKIHMTAEWRNWHIYNYVLHGLCEELISLGAKPSLKGKVLWLWAKYIQKYQNKVEFNKFMKTKNHLELEANSDEDQEEEEVEDKHKSSKLNSITIKAMYSILCVGLNLDRSHLTPNVVMRFIKEGRINYRNYKKYVPIKLSARELMSFLYSSSILFTTNSLSAHCSELFSELDIGSPRIPDLKAFISIYIKELCMPNEFRDLVHSLIDFMPFDIAVDAVGNRIWKIFPQFDLIAMSYVIIAFKMCFGLDDRYDLEVSAQVDSINDKRDLPKCYKGYNQSTGRLFSLTEWMQYMDYRKYVLCKYYQPLATKFRIVDDDCVLTEMLKDRKVSKVDKMSENNISHDLLNSIPNDTFNFLAKNEFPHSLTPLSTYTAHIVSQTRDLDTRLRLSEDFSKYSMKYACVDLKLDREEACEESGTRTTNMIRGPAKENKIVNTGLKNSVFNILRAASDTQVTGRILKVNNTRDRDWFKEYKKARYIDTGFYEEGDEELLQPIDRNMPEARREKIKLLKAMNVDVDKLPLSCTNRWIHVKKTLRRDKFLTRHIARVDPEEQRLIDALRIKPKRLPLYYQSYCTPDSGKDEEHYMFISANIYDKSGYDSQRVENLHKYQQSPYSSHAIEQALKDKKRRESALSDRLARLQHVRELKARAARELARPVKQELREIPDLPAGQNVFDDDFEPFEPQTDVKLEREDAEDYHMFDFTQTKLDDDFEEKPPIDYSAQSLDEGMATPLVPPNFDRHKCIHEIIMKTCAKYKIPVPRDKNAPKLRRPRQDHTTTHKDKSVDTAIPTIKANDLIRSYFERLKNISDNLNETIAESVFTDEIDALKSKENSNFDTCIPDDMPLGQDDNDCKDDTINDIISLDDETVVEEPKIDMTKDVDLQKIIAKSKMALDSESKKTEALLKLRKMMRRAPKKITDIRVMEEPSEPLIKQLPESFNYFTKHYREHVFKCSANLAFREELLLNFPKSFAFVLETCAALVEASPFHLYQHVQSVEKKFMSWSEWVEELHRDNDARDRMNVVVSVAEDAGQGDEASRSGDDVCDVYVVLDDSDDDGQTK